MKLPLFVLVIWMMMLSDGLSAQPYEHSGGVRAGYSSGLTYKGFFRYRMNAIEAGILYNRHGFNLTGLFEVHMEPFRNDRWLVFVGGGAFGGNWNGDISIGLAPVAGIEYVVRDLPLNFSLDWKPMANLYREMEVDFLDFGISIRYRFSL
ncbi:MAG: hypothetical protein ACWGNV_14840 [Bacteroidales bacterium]